MPVELKVPAFGESITEAVIGDWLKSEGDDVSQDEGVVVLETDKITSELPAPVSGKLTKLLKEKGETVNVGDVIGYMEEGEVRVKPQSAAAGDGRGSTATAGARTGGASGGNDRQPHVMPAARRELAQHGMDASQVTASGPGGRVLKEDVIREITAASAHGAQRRVEERAGGAMDAVPAPGMKTPGVTTPDPGTRREEIVPMSPLRKRVAERLVQSQQTAALLTTFNEIDMSAVIALRKEYQEAFQKKYGVKLGFMSFFVKSAIEALKLVPAVNAEIRGTDIVYRNYYDIGVAVGGGRGLVVPVVRSAERLSMAEIERTIGDFAERARANKLALEELQGGTFTISNGGIYGSLLSTPIINPPQSGILGLHAIQERAVVRDGAVVARPMMYVALTYDHRLVDGREAVTFLKRIKECMETPARIFLEV